MAGAGSYSRGRAGEGSLWDKLFRCFCALVLAFSMWPGISYADTVESDAGAAESEQAEEAADSEESLEAEEVESDSASEESEQEADEAISAEQLETEDLEAEGDLSTLASFDLTGSGTEEDPYVIDSASDWAQFFTAVNTDTDGTYRSASYELTCDIDLSSSDLGDEYQSPIAPDDDYAFTGTFDGGGYTVSNLAISSTDSYQALFGYVDDATIENLTVEGSVSGKYYLAGIVGYAENSTLSGLVNEASVTSTSYGSGGVGGVVGQVKGGTVSNCGNSGDLTTSWSSVSSTTSNNKLGGIVGYAYSTSSGCNPVTIDGCWNTGDISGDSTICGGIIGYAYPSNSSYEISITNCYNRGDLSYTGSKTSSSYRSYIGGLIGYVSSNWTAITIENCYSAGALSSNNSSYCQLGALVARTTSSTVSTTKVSNNYYLEGIADYAIYSSSTSSSSGWITTSDDVVETRTETEFKTAGMAAELGSAYSDDTGATQYNEGWPYLTWQNPNATYSASISVSLANENNESSENAISIVITDSNGVDVTSEFTESEDATSTQASWTRSEVENGTTYNYTVSKKGYETATGSITANKGNAVADIELEPTAYSYTLTVSPADSDLKFYSGTSALSASGTSTSEDGASCTYTFSGLYNNDVLSYTVSRFGYEEYSSETFSLSFADGSGEATIYPMTNYAVTMNVTTPDSSSDSSSGDLSLSDLEVDADVPDEVVELLEEEATEAAEDGETDVPIVIAYYDDDDSDYDGTLVYNSREDEAAPEAATDGSFTYSLGDLIDGDYGYVAYAFGYPTATGSFTVAGADLVVDVTISETSTEPWDGSSVDIGWWYFNQDETDYYIYTAAELAGFSALVGGGAVDYNGNDIDAVNFEGKTVHLMADIDLGGEAGVYWTPIGAANQTGTSGTSSNSFAGVFDGEGHTISNMLVGDPDEDNAAATTRLHNASTASGLFSKIAGSSDSYAAVRDLTIEDADVSVDSGSSAAAAGAGILTSMSVYATIDNVTISGGLIADASSTEDSIVGIGRYYVGGLVGRAVNTAIADCSNSADVYSAQYGVGGLVGYLQYSGSSITRCANTGTVGATGTSYSSTATYGLGGIVGQVVTTGIVIDACYNSGTVSGSMASVGGILGATSSSAYPTISNSYNRGTVQNSSSSGSSSNGLRVGGIAGTCATNSSYTAFENCYSAATVGSTDETSTSVTLYAGALLGYASTSAKISTTTATNNYYDADVAGDEVEGAIGRNYSSSSQNVDVSGAMEASTTETMTGGDFDETLGSDYFCDDLSGEDALNGGYPILRWQDPDAEWTATFTMELDTAINDDLVVTENEDGTTSFEGTMPTLTVYDESGAVVSSGDEVSAVEDDGEVGYVYTATLTLPNGDYSYTISKQGYNETQDEDGDYVSLTEGSITVRNSDYDEDVSLVATKYAYTVNVVDSAEIALADATVEVREGGSEGTLAEPTSYDSATSSYVYELYNGSYWVSASKYGYEGRETGDDELVSISYGSAENTVILTALATADLTITASPESGSFADNKATLSLSCEEKDFDAVTAETDEYGTATFLVEDLAVGTYEYTVRAGGFASQSGTVEVTEEGASLDLVLEEQESWDGESIDVSWYDEESTELHISNADELAGFAAIVNGTATDEEGNALSDTFLGKTVYLDAPIDLGGYQWTPIGLYYSASNYEPFSGTFDGQNNAITGLYIDVEKCTGFGAGLFGAASAASFQNVVVSGNIEGTEGELIFPMAGIVAYARNGNTFTDCGSSVSIEATVSGIAYAGGLVGWGADAFTATGCYNKGSFSITCSDYSSGTAFAGGLAGYSNGVNTITACYNTGDLSYTTAQSYLYIGGLLGSGSSSSATTISNAYNAGTITGSPSTYAGALVGTGGSSSSTITAAYYLEDSASSSVGSFRGTDASSSVSADELKAADILTSLNDGLDSETQTVFTENSAGGYPLLSWERDLLSVTVNTDNVKTSYNDMEDFDDSGLVLTVTYTNGYSIEVDSGWTIENGESLAVGQESVTIDYSGWTFDIYITVTQIEHETTNDIELSLAGPVAGETAASTAEILGEDDGTYSASVAWTAAGESFSGSFEAGVYYRAQVTVSTYYEDDAWWVLPEDVEVTITAADGTPEPLEVVDAARSEDGQSYTLTCTYDALEGASEASGLTSTAFHLYYEGQSDASLYNYALDLDPALTLSVEGEEQTFTLEDIESGALDGTYDAYEGLYSGVDGDDATYTGIQLYNFLYDSIGARASDDTEVTFVAYSGAEYTTTIGDLRMSLYSYDEDGEASEVPWLLAFGCDGEPLMPSTSLLQDVGPLMLVGGQASSSAAATVENVVRIEIDELDIASTRTVTFSVSCDGEELDDVDIEVTDGFGNSANVENGRCTITQDEEYSYTVSCDGYTTQTGTLSASEDDETISIELLEVYSGSYDEVEDEPAINEEGAYLIYTAEELMWWADNGTRSDSVILMDDIALNDGSSYDEDSNQWPLEKFGQSEDVAFTGTFDGNGHTIYGLYIYRENTLDIWDNWDGSSGMIADNVSQIGMFGYATNATIKNLGVEGVIEVLDRPDSMYATWMQIGGLVGYGTNVTIENCTTNMGIYHTQATGSGSIAGVPYDGWPEYQDAYVGGIIGTAANSTISNCYTRGEICSYGSRTTNIGGVVGRAYQYTTNQTIVENCYSTATISADPEWGSESMLSYQGGVVGEVQATDTASVEGPIVRNCVAANESIDGGESDYSVAYRVAGGPDGSISNCYGLSTMDIVNATTDSTETTCNGTAVSAGVVTASSLYLESAGWTENNDSTVTETSTGWQFVADETPYLYWEDTSNGRSDDMSAIVVDPESSIYEGDDSDSFSEYAPPDTFTISVQVGDYETEQIVYSSKELMGMAYRPTSYLKYSGYNASGNPYGRIVAMYIPFEELFEDAGLSFESGDTLEMGGNSYDYDSYFGTTRYYYPTWADDASSTEGAEEVPTALVIRSYGTSMNYGVDGDTMLDIYAAEVDYLYAYMIAFGQTTTTEQNVGEWVYQQTEASVVYDEDDPANDYVDGLISDLIDQAASDLANTTTGDEASEVSKGTQFVSEELMQELQAALEAARTAQSGIDAGTATNGDVIEAYEDLLEAVDAFEAAVQTGTASSDFTSLESVFQIIEQDGWVVEGEDGELKLGDDLVISEDGSDVDTDANWVSQELFDALAEAYSDATAYLDDYYVSQDDVEAVAEAFTAIYAAFVEGICYGTVDISEVTIAAIAEQTYTGSAIEPVLELTYGDATLVAGEDYDYTVEYADNVNVGTATVTITGTGNNMGSETLTYINSTTVSFNIVAASLADATIVLNPDSYTYSGDACEPVLSVTVGELSLVEGTDYTVDYSDNTDAGTATATITGIGNWTDTASASFEIAAQSIEDATVETDEESYTFTGSAIEPAVSVTTSGGVELTLGEDYTVAYSDNVDAGTATATVTGTGNYTGTASCTYEITAAGLEDATVATDAESYTYTGSAIEPAVTVTASDGTVLVEGTDYTVAYSDNTEAGTATVTVTGTGNYSGTASATYEITAASLADATVATEAESYTYTGSAIEPAVTVTASDGTVLVEGTDYTVDYADNVDVGTATVTVTGMGNWAETASGSFEVTARSIEDAVVASDAESYVFTGSEIEPAVTVTLDGVELALGEDYTVDYLNNVDAGTAIIVVTGIGNYTDSASGTFTIGSEDFSDAQIMLGYASTSYTGEAKEPAVYVVFEGQILVEGSDYTVSYSDNVDAGTATVTVSGTGNYAGTLSASFEITAASLEDAAVATEAESYTYTGSAIEPAVTVTASDGTVLVEGEDYTVEYSDNAAAGTATVTVTGTGNYSGTASATYEITAASIADATVATDAEGYTYTGSAIEPAVTVTLSDGTVLVEGTDYTVSYSDNTQTGTATVTVTGVGNYTGTASTTFEIAAAGLEGATVTTEAESYGYTGSAIEPAVTVTAADGTVLVEGTDYTVSYSDNTEAGTATVTVTGTGNYTGTASTSFEIAAAGISDATVATDLESYTYTGGELQPTVTVTLSDGTVLVEGEDYTVEYADNVEVGTGTATVTGIGNYAGTASVEFAIGAADLSGAVVSTESDSYDYTGEAIEAAVTVSLNGEELVEGVDYTLEYADNVEAGTASVTVTGIGNYAGTASGSFTIEAAALSDATLSLEADSCEYTGEAIEPAVTVTAADGTELVEGTDYTVEYSDNTEAGTATVTVTGIGNYEGSLSASFQITAPEAEEEEEEAWLFLDVMDESKYYFEPIYALVDLGYVTGYDDEYFGVGDDMTRGQFVTIIWRIAGEPEASGTAESFSDVAEGVYYSEAVAWAAGEGVVDGYGDGRFGPTDSMSFEQMCLIIARYANGGDEALEASIGEAEAAEVLADFSDGDEVSSWAEKGMAFCVQEGLVEGETDGSLLPDEIVARERVATVLWRAVEGDMI